MDSVPVALIDQSFAEEHIIKPTLDPGVSVPGDHSLLRLFQNYITDLNYSPKYLATIVGIVNYLPTELKLSIKPAYWGEVVSRPHFRAYDARHKRVDNVPGTMDIIPAYSVAEKKVGLGVTGLSQNGPFSGSGGAFMINPAPPALPEPILGAVQHALRSGGKNGQDTTYSVAVSNDPEKYDSDLKQFYDDECDDNRVHQSKAELKGKYSVQAAISPADSFAWYVLADKYKSNYYEMTKTQALQAVFVIKPA